METVGADRMPGRGTSSETATRSANAIGRSSRQLAAASAAIVGRADRMVGAHVSSQQAIGEANPGSGELSPQHDEQRAVAGFETDPAATAAIIRTRMKERTVNVRTAFPGMRIPGRASGPSIVTEPGCFAQYGRR